MRFRLSKLITFATLNVLIVITRSCPVSITKNVYGRRTNANGVLNCIYQFTLKNCHNFTVKIITYGATVTSIYTPDAYGNVDDVVLGFNDLKGYESKDNPYFGATLGRVSNRIANGSFVLNGITYNVEKNEGEHTLHGGFHSFSKVIWDAEINSEFNDAYLRMSYISPEGEAGFPGEIRAYVFFRLSPIANELIIEYFATTSKPTPINLSNHGYYNLAGQHTGSKGLFEHIVEINANQYTVLNEQSIPTGEIRNVDNTGYDLRMPKLLGSTIYNTPTHNGFDINYVLIPAHYETFAAKVSHPKSRRYVTMHTDQPGMQFYTSNSLSNVTGKNGIKYEKFGAFCLEAQKFPDAVHHANFPNTIITPEFPYRQITRYTFGIL